MTRAAIGMAGLRVARTLVVLAVVLLSIGAGPARGGEKEDELNLALEDLTAAVHLVSARVATAAAMLAQLQAQAEALKDEIQSERRRAGAATLRQALQVRRIDGDWRLLQQAAAYSLQLEDRLAHFRRAITRLNGYREQVRDDLLLLRTLEAVDSTALLRRVRESVGELRLQCAAPLLAAGSLSAPRDPDALWNEILRRP
jgi:hypothetical protein